MRPPHHLPNKDPASPVGRSFPTVAYAVAKYSELTPHTHPTHPYTHNQWAVIGAADTGSNTNPSSSYTQKACELCVASHHVPTSPPAPPLARSLQDAWVNSTSSTRTSKGSSSEEIRRRLDESAAVREATEAATRSSVAA